MIHLLLPPDNRMASSSAAVQSSKIRLADLTAALIDTSNGRVCVLKFSNLICKRCEKEHFKYFEIQC